MQTQAVAPSTLAAQLAAVFPPEVILEVVGGGRFAAYKDDPVGFCRNELGDTVTDDVARMMESVRDHEITIAVSANATGKTHGAARVAVWWYKSHAHAQVYTAAAPPMDNLERLLWGEISGLVTKHPGLFDQDAVKSLHVSRSPLDFVAGVTIPSSGTSQEREAKFSGKHAPNLLFILDEGDAIPDEVFRGFESCMSGGRVRLLVMFNPRQKSGHAYKLIQEGKAHVVHLNALSHPNVVTGEDVIPGAVTRAATVRRINEWCRPAVPGEQMEDGEDTFDLPEFLVGATTTSQSGQPYAPLKAGRYVIMESAFSYMVLGRYPAQAVNQLISEAWIQRARARWDAHVRLHGETAPDGMRPVMGMDVAEDGVDYNCCYFRAGGWTERPSRWRGMDIPDSERRGMEEYYRRRAIAAMVDATGVGAGVAPHMREKGVNAHKVKSAWAPTVKCEFGEFKILRDQLLWAVREWLRADPTAMLPPEPLLLEELRVPTYEVKGGKVRVMMKDVMKLLLGRSPNDLDALANTFADAGTMLDPLDLEGVFQ